MLSLILLVVLMASLANADVYLQNPRGSNDRNCERNENRNNGNRLFDSQNNDKGGYACPRAVGGPEVVTPRMYYYQGSQLRVEWTNQHGCGTNPNTYCDLILQYMCEDANPLLADGIPEDSNDAATDRMSESDYILWNSTSIADQIAFNRFGYHETYDYFQSCYYRERNMGLWISDQQVNNGQGASVTRQQNNQNRDGWECQEERDYYPYWHPSPWKDIAVLTSDTSRCSWFQSQSQNVKSTNECVMEPDMNNGNDGGSSVANQPDTCAAAGGTWATVPSKGLPAPECLQAPYTRDNHLGNIGDGEMARYFWIIPSVTCEKAVLRLRYNLTNFNVDYNYDYKYNSPDVYPPGSLNGAPMTNPNVMAFDHTVSNTPDGSFNLSIKVNTNQYGRTFQDRTYLFGIVPVPPSRREGNANPIDGMIYNLNVRGKRGNIVQTYPAVEYDFVPASLSLLPSDYMHIQWTGSDYNPDRDPNNGNGGPTDPANPGTYRADRSNMVQIDALNHNRPSLNPTLFENDQLRTLFSYIKQDLSMCLTYEQLFERNGGNSANVATDIMNCMKLNAAQTPYFDGGLVPAPKVGTYYYFSSRANNFSNRGQKGTITVLPPPLSTTTKAAIGVGVTGVSGAAVVGGSWMYAKRFPDSLIAKGFSKLHL